jgi:vacuolar-type H+-ATPase subunit H
MTNPNETKTRRDPFEELNRRIESALEEVRPKVRRAFEELEQRVDEALQDLKPRVEEARVRARPRVDEFVADVQPRIDSLLSRVQTALDGLRRDLGVRASRAEARRSPGPGEPGAAPWPEDTDGADKNNDPPKETVEDWPTRDSRDETPGGGTPGV